MSVRDRARRTLERLVAASATERALISLASLAASIVVGVGIVLVAGRTATCGEAAFVLASPRPFGVPELFRLGFCFDPVAVFDRLFLGALGDPFSPAWDPRHPLEVRLLRPGWDPLNGRMATTLRETAVLVFTGLSVALAFRAGVFNIGTQGQLIAGALATAVAVLWASTFVAGVVGTLVLIPFGVLVGAVGGGLYGAIPGALKAYADANEVVTTIMLNFIASGVALYLVRSTFKDPTSPANQTIPLPDHALFPPLLFAPQFGFSILALLFGLLAAGGVFVLLRRTVFGYDLRASGLQPAAAEYGGVDARRTVVASMTLSGALGGIGGAVYVLMVLGKFQTNVPAYGFDGITVAILAGNNPLGVALAAFLFGVLKSGTTVVQFATDVPPQLVGVLRGLIILFVAMPEFFRLLGRRVLPRDRPGGEAVAADAGTDPTDRDEEGAAP
jgi:simple sugar transport system permease protein